MVNPEENQQIKGALSQLQVSECETKLQEILCQLDECGEAVSAAFVSDAIDALGNKR